jgi:hypothetical protein
LGGWDQECFGWRPAQANSSWVPVSKITTAKRNGSVTQTIERLLYQCKALSSKPSSTKKKKRRNTILCHNFITWLTPLHSYICLFSKIFLN